MRAVGDEVRALGVGLVGWVRREAAAMRTGVPPGSDVTPEDIEAFLQAHERALRRDGLRIGGALFVANALYGTLDAFTFQAIPEVIGPLATTRAALLGLGALSLLAVYAVPGWARVLGVCWGFLVPMALAWTFAKLGPPSAAWLHFVYPFLLSPLVSFLAPWTRVWTTVGVGAATLITYFASSPSYLADPLTMATILFTSFCVVFVALYGLVLDRSRLLAFKANRELDADRRFLSEEVQRRTEALRELTQRLDAELEGQRRHIARELHDELGQMIAATRVSLRLAARRAEGGAGSVVPNLRQTAMLLDRLTASTRDLLSRLRVPVVDELGLVAAIERLVRDTEANTGVRHQLRVVGEPAHLAPAVATAAYRCVQEALSNCAKYAEASEVEVLVRADAATLEVHVRDDGVGVCPGARWGLGLTGMAERAQAQGGTVTVASPGRGTSVRMRLPLGAGSTP